VVQWTDLSVHGAPSAPFLLLSLAHVDRVYAGAGSLLLPLPFTARDRAAGGELLSPASMVVERLTQGLLRLPLVEASTTRGERR